jgi:hypothetical protein
MNPGERREEPNMTAIGPGGPSTLLRVNKLLPYGKVRPFAQGALWSAAIHRRLIDAAEAT